MRMRESCIIPDSLLSWQPSTFFTSAMITVTVLSNRSDPFVHSPSAVAKLNVCSGEHLIYCCLTWWAGWVLCMPQTVIYETDHYSWQNRQFKTFMEQKKKKNFQPCYDLTLNEVWITTLLSIEVQSRRRPETQQGGCPSSFIIITVNLITMAMLSQTCPMNDLCCLLDWSLVWLRFWLMNLEIFPCIFAWCKMIALSGKLQHL